MIHCVDCDDEECDLMPYCLDYQDLLVHMEECTEKKCRMKVSSQHVISYLSSVFSLAPPAASKVDNISATV